MAACAIASSIYAQRSSETEVLKAVNKNWATELNVNPFNGSISLNNSLNQIKVRKFFNDRYALRIGFNANQLTSNLENGNPYGTNPTIYKNERNSTTIGLNVGFEKHFAGTRRLSPYLGLDLALGNKSSKQEITSGTTTTTVKGAWQTITYTNVYNPNTNSYQLVAQGSTPSEEAYVSYGLNIASGFDFYISKSFFFGYEFNFGFNSLNYKDIKVSQTGTPSTNNNSYSDQKNTSFKFGPSLINGIRLGYVIK
jgi:hypothetical protein